MHHAGCCLFCWRCIRRAGEGHWNASVPQSLPQGHDWKYADGILDSTLQYSTVLHGTPRYSCDPQGHDWNYADGILGLGLPGTALPVPPKK